MREIWYPRPLISAGGYTRDHALEVAETKGDLIAFGRYFISNVSSLLLSLHPRNQISILSARLATEASEQYPAQGL